MIRPDGAESNVQENESIPRVNLTPSKITDEYVECDVRLVAGKESGIGGGQDAIHGADKRVSVYEKKATH